MAGYRVEGPDSFVQFFIAFVERNVDLKKFFNLVKCNLCIPSERLKNNNNMHENYDLDFVLP